MNRERLLKLAEHLDAVPADAFDLNYWGRRVECGSTCCALGHACSVPEFRAAGLTLVWDRFDNEDGEQTATVVYDATGFPDGYRAAVAFFGLSTADAAYLFSPDWYDAFPRPTPGDVARRIRQTVARGPL